MLKSTLALKKSDDLFEKSSMSFGEHLEELRVALIRASYWLIAGLVIGIPSATTVVSYFQTPLEAALDQFYRKESARELASVTGTTISPSLEAWMEKNHRQAELLYVDQLAINRMSTVLPGRTEQPGGADRSNSANLKSTDPSSANAAEPKTDPKADSAVAAEVAAEDAAEKGIESTSDKSVAKTGNTAAGSSGAEASVSAELNLSQPSPNDLVPIWAFTKIKSQSETFQMHEGMMIWFKAALVVAFIVASPGIFYHVWGFVSAGLYPHERRYVYFFLPTSIALFWIGALFAFFVVFQMVISFLLNFNSMMGVGTTPRLNDYMSFALMLPIGFGLSFQLPLVMLIVERLGIVTVQQYLAQWRMATFIIAVSSMVLTPGGDVTSMIAMTVPLIFLYFLGIALCKYLPRAGMMNGSALDPK